MRLARSLVSFLLIFSLGFISFVTLPVQAVSAQSETKIALQRGYRTGYSDGYMAGYRDAIDSSAKDYNRHGEYSKADRAYNKDYGTVEDYRDGYKQGFESGYDTGFEKKSFDAAIPANIGRRGITAAPSMSDPAPVVTETTPAVTEPAVSETQTATVESAPVVEQPVSAKQASIQKVVYVASDEPVIIIPRDTELILELDEALDTERNREGDKFTAKIVSPAEIAGATVEGRIEKVTKPGRLKRRSEMLLSFDRVVLSEKRWTNFNAILTEVLPVKGDNVKKVDDEGVAIGKRSHKEDGLKVGASTGAGAGVGALVGGPVGAAVGAGVGAAFGVGAVVIERGKHIKLNQSQQLRIKTSYETQIR